MYFLECIINKRISNMIQQKKETAMFETKTMVLVTPEFLQEILNQQERILQILTSMADQKKSIGDYISESDAKKMLGRNTTWFWNLRKTGKLPFTKVGNKVFYTKTDIFRFLEGNKREVL